MEMLTQRFSGLNTDFKKSMFDALVNAGASPEQAHACCVLFSNLNEALPYIGKPAKGGNGFREAWKEYYSQKYQRFYYCNSETGANTWDMPCELQLRDWLLDSELFHVSIEAARDVGVTLLRLLEENWSRPDALWEAISLMSRITANVASSSNQVEKYRCIKMDNPQVRDKLAPVPGVLDVLDAAGWNTVGARASAGAAATRMITFPPPTQLPDESKSADAAAAPSSPAPWLANTARSSANGANTAEVIDGPLSRCRLAASKLSQLQDKKGFTGSAISVDDTASGQESSSKYSNQPGFRYQQEIYECSTCSRPINDGSERLFTRSHDAPKGEFRYECQQCPPKSFNLCETCWDAHLKGNCLHAASHTFTTHHPKMSRHNVYSAETDRNPWGVFLGGGSSSRARERLRERTGM